MDLCDFECSVLEMANRSSKGKTSFEEIDG